MIGQPTRSTCSRAGCRRLATAAITWQNPRIHTGDRHKIWLACDDHVSVLREFLAARAFPLTVRPFEAGTLADGAAPADGTERVR